MKGTVSIALATILGVSRRSSGRRPSRRLRWTAEMLKVMASLSQRQFYKSMTTHADSRIWQDVYHAATPVRKDAYIEITLRDTAPVIQFKER